ncbi:PASTA domain-containing protein [Algoriphagus sp.]|uniref:PASTA domain-containing protein n=1 Tax=Algoriphagus sp. TaxID=1872435 RepID=UPI00391C9EC7
MNSFSSSFKKILVNLLIVIGLTALLGFLFLKVYLPFYTHHGETVTVPDLSGYRFLEASQLLKNTGLQYEVSVDSGFSADLPALAILKQIPDASSQVKTGRRVYLTLNARNAPLLKMPNLVNMPLKNVQEILSNIGLQRGDIVYVPDIGINVVLDQRYRGVSVKEGFEIPKGATIDLLVGDGMGNQLLFVPDLKGLEEEEAEFLILGSGLRLGNKNYSSTDSVASGRVFLQSPGPGMEVRTGELINIWISKN